MKILKLLTTINDLGSKIIVEGGIETNEKCRISDVGKVFEGRKMIDVIYIFSLGSMCHHQRG